MPQPSPTAYQFSQNLKLWMLLHSVSIEELASAMLVSVSTVNRWRSGNSSALEFDTLDRLTDYTEKSADWFFTKHQI